VTRIPLLALFFVAAVDFSLDKARIDLVLMTAALTILLWGGLRSPSIWGAHCDVLWPQPSSTSQGTQAHRTPRQEVRS